MTVATPRTDSQFQSFVGVKRGRQAGGEEEEVLIEIPSLQSLRTEKCQGKGSVTHAPEDLSSFFLQFSIRVDVLSSENQLPPL